MFQHAHVYIAKKLYKSDNPLLLVGSFIPDIAVTKIIPWEGGLHGEESVRKLYDFTRNTDEAYLNLYYGVLAHNILDDFAHSKYQKNTGYAFQNNKKLMTLVGKYYELKEERSKGIAHNFIESAVDIMLLKDRPQIQGEIQRAIFAIDKNSLSSFLGSYFDIKSGEFLDTLNLFFNLFTRYDFTKNNSWVLLWRDLEKLLMLKDIDEQKRTEIMETSVQVVIHTYKDFLDYSLREGLKRIN